MKIVVAFTKKTFCVNTVRLQLYKSFDEKERNERGGGGWGGGNYLPSHSMK